MCFVKKDMQYLSMYSSATKLKTNKLYHFYISYHVIMLHIDIHITLILYFDIGNLLRLICHKAYNTQMPKI